MRPELPPYCPGQIEAGTYTPPPSIIRHTPLNHIEWDILSRLPTFDVASGRPYFHCFRRVLGDHGSTSRVGVVVGSLLACAFATPYGGNRLGAGTGGWLTGGMLLLLYLMGRKASRWNDPEMDAEASSWRTARGRYIQLRRRDRRRDRRREEDKGG